MALTARIGIRKSRLAAAAFALAAVFPAGACRHSRLSRSDAAPVVVVARPSGDASPRSLEEREPNDSPAQAQLLVLDPEWPVIDVKGSLSSAAAGNDVDVFKFLVPGDGAGRGKIGERLDSAPPEDPRAAARRLTLEIAPESGASVSLQALGDGLKVLEGVTAENGEAAGIPNLAVQPGHLYYFRVKAYSKPGKPAGTTQAACKYKFSLQLGDFEVGDEREPNDSMETAEPVAMTGLAELAGFHGWQHDQDFYRVSAPEVASALDVVLGGVEGVVPGLQILDGNGARLAVAKGRKGERLTLHNVRIGAAGADAGAGSRFFYVVVGSEAGQDRAQRYILHLVLGAIEEGTEIEPNDTPASANPVGDGVMTAFLPAGDVDYFLYHGGEAREVALEVSFPAHLRGVVEVVRLGKPDVVASAETKKAHQQLILPKVVNLGEPLLIRIAPVKGEGNANQAYLLRISSAPSAERASAAQTPVSP